MLALIDYHQAHGALPPAVLPDKDGRPLHSWRVLLLPYLDQKALYDQFHLDEPWDSPHNLPLLGRMPKVFQSPEEGHPQVGPCHTFFHVLVGKGTPFEGPEGLRIDKDLPKGSSNTILIVHGGEPVPWAKPEEIPYAADRALPALATVVADGFYAGMADGRTIFIGKTVGERSLRAAITRTGRDVPGEDFP
jgi:hypothetical protein